MIIVSRQRIDSRGISIVEALVALLILGVAMLGLVKLQGQTMLSMGDSRMKTHALAVAQDKIEELRSFAHRSEFDAYADSANDTIPGVSGAFTRIWTLIGCTGSVLCKQIHVSVSWTDHKGETQTVQLTSNIASLDPVRGGKAIIDAAE